MVENIFLKYFDNFHEIDKVIRIWFDKQVIWEDWCDEKGQNQKRKQKIEKNIVGGYKKRIALK